MYIVQYARRISCFSLGLGIAVSSYIVALGLAVSIFSFDCISTVVALAVVRVSSGYFPVFECIPYSMQEGFRVSR